MSLMSKPGSDLQAAINKAAAGFLEAEDPFAYLERIWLEARAPGDFENFADAVALQIES